MRPASRWTPLPARLRVPGVATAILALLLYGCGGGGGADGEAADPVDGAAAGAAATEPTVRIVPPDRSTALGAGSVPGPIGH